MPSVEPRSPVGRTVAIVVAAAALGGFAGAAVGLAVGAGRSRSSAATARVAAPTTTPTSSVLPADGEAVYHGVAHGHAEHVWLGAELETVDPVVARVVRGLPLHGVVVVRVTNRSPASAAGIVAATRHVTVDGVGAVTGGDAIVALDGARVASSGRLTELLAHRAPGDRVRLTLVRGGVSRSVDVTLGSASG